MRMTVPWYGTEQNQIHAIDVQFQWASPNCNHIQRKKKNKSKELSSSTTYTI